MSKRKLSFRWFGSLSNLSFRRLSDKGESKSALKHHGSLSERTGGEKSIDDMDLCPHSPSYARSSDMYTHMGTMPRPSLKKEKSLKGSKKGKGKTELNRKQSQRQAGDYVCESPLLMALSSQGKQTLEGPPRLLASQAGSNQDGPSASGPVDPQLSDARLRTDAVPVGRPAATRSHSPLSSEAPAKPNSSKTSALTLTSTTPAPPLSSYPSTGRAPDKECLSQGVAKNLQSSDDPRSQHKGTLQEKEGGDSGMATQEELQGKELETATLQEAQESELQCSDLDTMDTRCEYVKFSKEKYLLDSPPEKLRKELEEELKLSSSDMRSHGWYHGHIPREVSETLVLRNGDFLIRDSLTSAGDYVLTSRWNHEVLHFKISKVLVKSNESRVQYLLERESFDSVPALVRYYVSSRRTVSQQSGAQIYCPINRTLPLRYLEATFALANGRHGLAHSPSSQRGAYIKRRSVTMTDGLTTEKIIPHSPSTVHHKEAMRNCALSMDQIQEFRCPLSPVGETPLSPAYSSITRHRSPSGGRVLGMIPSSPVLRRSSEPQLSPSSNNNVPYPELNASAHSTPAHGYPAEGAGGSYCELGPSPVPIPSPTTPAKSYVERLRVEEGGGALMSRDEGGEIFVAPLVETTSAFKPTRYQSPLMPAENKPLEVNILKRVKELLAEVDAKTAAKHITKADCTVARILGVTKEMQGMMGVGSGLELLTLPHGHQLRLDLLERFYTMSIMMAVDLLGCTGSTEERAALLHKTIQLAAELKSNLGNMFGFAAVMRALELPQIARLEQTWMTLRQRHTEGAILYEKKLKPFMKSMNDGKESSVLSNTSFPHVVPLLSLLERGVVVGEGVEPWESMESGVDVVMSHLEAARTIAHHGGIYRTNAETKLQGFQEQEEVLELFHTDFQMRLLWGSRGAEGSQVERYEKFDKVLTALSNKLEPPVRQSEL
ncbi:SH2 domain-containing protein 3C isoform X1 [Megalops cyprinoides]|uniref:SH2 domain-containing protein 3C isoform X1 n=2 Tax=Megalops cyprinoides TaxID=118141 RepID=UPI001863C557|nr:SH2 domain-containing protein 3C isoform X1 [Megalops cyprinoides]